MAWAPRGPAHTAHYLASRVLADGLRQAIFVAKLLSGQRDCAESGSSTHRLLADGRWLAERPLGPFVCPAELTVVVYAEYIGVLHHQFLVVTQPLTRLFTLTRPSFDLLAAALVISIIRLAR
jgi:hypothetical protein